MNECPGWETLAAPQAWSHEVRAHVAGCAACAAWCREHEAFAAGDAALPAAERERANARLTAFTRELVGATPAAAPEPAREPAAGSFLERLLGAFGAPPLRLAGALAVIAIVSAVVVARRETGEPRVGEATRGVAVESVAVLRDAGALGVALEWPVVAGADRYAIELLDPGMTVLATVESAAPACSVGAERLAGAAFARVVALHGADRIAELPPLPVPPR